MFQQGQTLTVFVQREFVEPEPTGLFAHKVVSELAAQVVDGDGVFQRFHTRLQTEGDLGVAHGVSVDKGKQNETICQRKYTEWHFRIDNQQNTLRNIILQDSEYFTIQC